MADREPRPYQFRLSTLFWLTAILAVPLGLLSGNAWYVVLALVEGFLGLLVVAWSLYLYEEIQSDTRSDAHVMIGVAVILLAIIVGAVLVIVTARGQPGRERAEPAVAGFRPAHRPR
jgi:4-hydroxybenzoate polyprenyltransferase